MKKKIIALMLILSLLFIGTYKAFDNSKFVIADADTSEILSKTTGKTIYASPDGLTSASGTESSPYALYAAFTKLTKGDTLILKNGTYQSSQRIRLPETQNGNALNYIKVIAEEVNKVTIDFSKMNFQSDNRGIQVDGDYWYFYGINITGAGDNGMYIGGNYNIVEMCQFYKNRDTGLQLGRSDGNYNSIKDWPCNNLIKNCTSFDNYDDETYGENADGFAAKLTTGEGNVFDGCIAYRNCDDGWDMYAKSDSGNVGLTIIKNCVSFENGWTLTSHLEDFRDETSNIVYTTRDGDGIGFKLGGSIMEGSVIIDNCIAFNNKLGGISDNSNPGVLSVSNCTVYNNSVTINADGSVGPSDGLSENIDLARKNMAGTNSDSYNNYYGILSYSTNATDASTVYSFGDCYKGAIGYSIFAKYSPSEKACKYYSFTDFVDGNSYQSDKAGTLYTGVINDSIFASVGHSWTTTGNTELHYTLRNADGSINIGDTLKVVDEDLLKYAEGKQIGANLAKASWADYDHYEFSEVKEGDRVDYIQALSAFDVLEVMCNKEAVFQDIKLLTLCNECEVSWTSSDPSVIKIGEEETVSFSSLSYIYGSVFRDRGEAHDVTLSATIKYNNAVLTKEFVLHVMQDEPAIGTISNYKSKYILDQYGVWTNPIVSVSNMSSNSGLMLEEGVDYETEFTYKYAVDKNSEFFEVSDVYTSVPGVYEVTCTVKSKMNAQDIVSTSFLVYVSGIYANLDASSSSGVSFHVANSGVDIYADLSSTSGYMYVYATSDVFASAQTIKANGERFEVSDEFIDITFEKENTENYYLFVVFVNKGDTYTSNIYSTAIQLKEISTCQEFYNFVNGSTSSTTIYSLKNDLDFQDFEWKESSNTSTFGGLFIGNDFTIKNITINGTSAKNVNIWYKVSGGTISDVNFENISLTGDGNSTTKVAIIGQMVDGYVKNVSMKNISAYAYQGAAALVGQMCGGVNYIHNVSLINDENQVIEVTGKYCGGLVGNLQKDTSESKVELYVDNCYVNATIGGTNDIGGYSGMIVGRYKNDYEVCVLSVSKCVVYGKVSTAKNYAGGITGGCDNGLGTTIIQYCVADIVLYYAGTLIDGSAAVSVKNGSPIIGRQTLGSGTFTYIRNYASFADYNAGVSDADDYTSKVSREYFWTTSVAFDMSLWTISDSVATLNISK